MNEHRSADTPPSASREERGLESWLPRTLARIADGEVLPTEHYATLDIERVLDARDAEAFEQAWRRAHAAVESAWRPEGLGADSAIDRLRQASFLAVSRATAQSEIAAYVSDDFELIAKAIALGRLDGFIARLWASYDRGVFPSDTPAGG